VDNETLDNLDDENLRKLLVELDALKANPDSQGTVKEILTDDDLHAWILQELDINVPRKAVCEGHHAPFQFIADLFFDRVDAALVVGSRGSGKSFHAALWNFLNCKLKPGSECLSIGAIEIQAKRVYSHVKQFQLKAAEGDIATTTISETLYKSGSKYSVVTGSLASVNGPHDQKVHRDEIELMDKNVYLESLQIERAKVVKGKEITSQSLHTSTRKTSDGLMQELLDECAEAEREGRRPPFKVYNICFREVMQEQPSCREAYPDLPEEEKCDCHLVQKGEFSEGKPRTFDKVCNGLLAKADGFIPLNDIHKTFVKSSKAIWEAQQENKRPYVEEVSFDNFSRERHGVRGFIFDPANGPVYQGLDFGGSSPFAAVWLQYLDFEIEVASFDGDPKRIPEGSIIAFAEVYKGNIGNMQFAQLIIEQERNWRIAFPKFRIAGRFGDPQASAAQRDLRRHDPPLMCSWPVKTRNREHHFQAVYELIELSRYYVCLDDCPMLVEEIESWNINASKKKFDHAVDANNYGISNLLVMEERRSHSSDSPSGRANKLHVPNQFKDTVPGARRSGLHSQTDLVNDYKRWREKIS
jgi:hypothetical protein